MNWSSYNVQTFYVLSHLVLNKNPMKRAQFWLLFSLYKLKTILLESNLGFKTNQSIWSKVGNFPKYVVHSTSLFKWRDFRNFSAVSAWKQYWYATQKWMRIGEIDDENRDRWAPRWSRELCSTWHRMGIQPLKSECLLSELQPEPHLPDTCNLECICMDYMLFS